jgi:ribosomal protein S25
MADLLSDVRKGLEKRLHELEPLVEEHAQVRAALDALKGTTAPIRRAVRSGAKAAKAASPATGRRGRPRGTGNRAQEALRHVHRQPGITIAELAKRMKIKPNYLYRVLPQLEKDGKIAKRDKGYHPQG